MHFREITITELTFSIRVSYIFFKLNPWSEIKQPEFNLRSTFTMFGAGEISKNFIFCLSIFSTFPSFLHKKEHMASIVKICTFLYVILFTFLYLTFWYLCWYSRGFHFLCASSYHHLVICFLIQVSAI